ncbi:MAG TPA: DinB family protein [Thermoanaerobaculia bacterium]|nr:DinB family protein [Thermoanaerobaculia bacterium]
MSLTPEQTRASDYLRRKGTQAPLADLRLKVAEAFRELDALVATVPEEVVRVRPRPGRWCVQEVVDHLVVSHRWAVEELEALIRGQVPEGGPIPASLQSPDAMEKEWPLLAREMSETHRRLATLVAEAPDDTPLETRAPVAMVIKARGADGELRPVQWIEELDWKAYAMAFRVHALEHVAQIRAILAELSVGEERKKEERPEENSRS